MARLLFLLLLSSIFSACYRSHSLPGAGAGGAPGGAHTGATAGAGAEIDEPSEAESTAGAGAELVEPSAGGAPAPVDEPINNLDPVLYRAIPIAVCSNKESWITIEGTGIDWRGLLVFSYPFSGAESTIEFNASDFADWRGLGELGFYISKDLPWAPPRRQFEHSLPSGDYLIRVVNENGKRSNDIGVNLQYCD